MSHLEDTIIESYLDQSLIPEKRRMVLHHIRSCFSCKRRLLVMQELYQALEQQQDHSVPSEWVTGVMRRVQNYALFRRRLNAISRIGLYVFVSLCCFAITVYYVDMQKMVQAFSLSKNVSELFMWDALNRYLSSTNLDISLLVAGVLIMVLIALVDSFLFQNRCS